MSRKEREMSSYEKEQDEMISKISMFVGIGLAALFIIVFIFTSMYSISETESAVVTTFGKAKVVEDKGLQFKIPFIQHVTKVDTTVRGFTVGYTIDKDGNYGDVDDESIMITSDYNFIDIDYYISYEVTDPMKYLYASSNPELILKNIAMSCIRSTLSAYTVDSALTTGKTEIQANVRQLIISRLEEEDIGIRLVEASMQDVEPPTAEVNDAFKAVETAKQGKESAINEANKYRNEQIPMVTAEADGIIQQAEASKTSRINEANGQVARFNSEYAEYVKYPLITKQRMFYETMEEVLPTLKIVIDNGDGDIQKYYPVESFANIFNTGN